jgi:hypothetical protein
MEIIAQICVSGLFAILGATIWTIIEVFFDESMFLATFFQFAMVFLIAFYLANYVLPNII